MRKLSPYEYNQLLKYGKQNINLNSVGETPIEYITGFCEFYNRDFIVNENVLIPRIETEGIINIVLDLIKDNQELTIADVGTGSGIIGITLFLELKNKDINPLLYLSDISGEALGVAGENIDKLIEEKESIKLFLSDLLNEYPKNLKFDLIVSNLPYIPEFRLSELDRSVKDYEPHLALFGGTEGLNLIYKLIEQSKERLKPNGYLVLEIDDTHTSEKFDGFKSDFEIELRNDEFGKSRFAVLKKI